MRKAKSLLGREVIARAEGKSLGTVRDLIFGDPSRGLLALLISDRELFGMVDATAVAWHRIAEIGRDAIIVEEAGALIRVHDDAELSAAYDARQTFDGKQVTTVNGENLGRISDLYLDDEGHVVGYEISDGLFADTFNGKRFLRAPENLTVGRDALIVPQDVLIEAQRERQERERADSDAAPTVLDRMRSSLNESYQDVANAGAQKQREWVVGKVAGRDVRLQARPSNRTAPATVVVEKIEIPPREMGPLVIKGRDDTLIQRETSVPPQVLDSSSSSGSSGSSGEAIEGEILVREGEIITREHAERAAASGDLEALVMAAALGHADATRHHVESSAQARLDEVRDGARRAALGKPAGREVLGRDGEVIVAPGMIITEQVLAVAERENKQNEVIAAAGMGAASQAARDTYEQARVAATDLWERLKRGAAQASDAAVEKRAEASDAAEKRRIMHALGRPVNRVILSRADEIILNTGDIITNRAIDLARQEGVLSILLDSVYDARPDITPEMMRAQGTGRATLASQPEPEGGAHTATLPPQDSRS